MKLGQLIAGKKADAKVEDAKVETGAVDSQEAAKPPVKATGLKLGSLPKPSPPPATSQPPAKSPSVTGLKLGGGIPKAQPKPAATVDATDLDLAGLASMDTSEIPETSSAEQSAGFAFPDEIEATAPARELPEDLTQQQKVFVESLDMIYEVLGDTDMLAQSIRNVMQELQQNPEYIQLVQDHDVHTMIKSIRNVMGIARIKKAEKKTTTRKTTGGKASKYDADTMAQLDALMAGIPDD